MPAIRTIRTSLPLAGISTRFLQELHSVVIYEDEDSGECAVLMPYDHYLEMQSLVLRADQLLDAMQESQE
jgi:hypothetical protein